MALNVPVYKLVHPSKRVSSLRRNVKSILDPWNSPKPPVCFLIFARLGGNFAPIPCHPRNGDLYTGCGYLLSGIRGDLFFFSRWRGRPIPHPAPMAESADALTGPGNRRTTWAPLSVPAEGGNFPPMMCVTPFVLVLEKKHDVSVR